MRCCCYRACIYPAGTSLQSSFISSISSGERRIVQQATASRYQKNAFLCCAGVGPLLYALVRACVLSSIRCVSSRYTKPLIDSILARIIGGGRRRILKRTRHHLPSFVEIWLLVVSVSELAERSDTSMDVPVRSKRSIFVDVHGQAATAYPSHVVEIIRIAF